MNVPVLSQSRICARFDDIVLPSPLRIVIYLERAREVLPIKRANDVVVVPPGSVHVNDPARIAEFFLGYVIVMDFLLSKNISYSVLVDEASVEWSS